MLWGKTVDKQLIQMLTSFNYYCFGLFKLVKQMSLIEDMNHFSFYFLGERPDDGKMEMKRRRMCDASYDNRGATR